MKSQDYSHGVIQKVHQDKDGLYYDFVELNDGTEIFMHEGRHHQLEVIPDGDVVFDPRNRFNQRKGSFRWEIKSPQEGDYIICFVVRAIQPHHRDHAHYWAYELDWHNLWFAEQARRDEAYRAVIAQEQASWDALVVDEEARIAAQAEEDDMFDLLDPDLVFHPEDEPEGVHNSSFWQRNLG